MDSSPASSIKKQDAGSESPSTANARRDGDRPASGRSKAKSIGSRKSVTRKSVTSRPKSIRRAEGAGDDDDDEERDNRPEFAKVQLKKLDTTQEAKLPEIEKRPEFSKFALRSVPVYERPLAARTLENSGEQPTPGNNLVKVEILPSGGLGQTVSVAGYGLAPGVVEVFSPEDDDDLVEADQLEQIELNVANEMAQQTLNMDLSTEYQKPLLSRALAFRRLHSPMRPDGSPWPYFSTRTGRFIPKWARKLDPCCEGRRSDFLVYGPGVSGYFKVVKSLIALFLFLCIFHIPTIFLNVNGGTRFTHSLLPFAQTTLGNLYLDYNASASLNDSLNDLANNYDLYEIHIPGLDDCGTGTGSACRLHRSDLLLYYSIWDAASVGIFFVALQMLKYFTNHEGISYSTKVPKIEDYSIECSVPRDADARGLQEHFENLLQDHVKELIDEVEEDFAEEEAAAGDMVENDSKHIPDDEPMDGGSKTGNEETLLKDAREARLQRKERDIAEIRAAHTVYDVQIVESTGNAISLCVTRGKLLKRMARLDARIKVMTMRNYAESRIAKYHKEFQHVLDRIEKIDDAAAKRAEKGHPLMAFITFESQEAKLKVLALYDVFWACGCQPKSLRYNEDLINVRPAPPPSTLLWENQEIAPANRAFRALLAFLILGGILAITAGISFWADNQKAFQELVNFAGQDSIQRCNGQYDALPIRQAAQAAQANGDTSCFCEYEILYGSGGSASNSTAMDTINTNSSAGPGVDTSFLFLPGAMCANYVAQKLGAIGQEVGLSIAISVLNVLVYFVVTHAADFQKFPSVVDREFAVLKAVFFITFVNAGVIVLMTNTNWGKLTGNSNFKTISVSGDTLIDLGAFVDFEPTWYEKVGVEVFLVALFMVFGPHFIPLLKYIYHEFQRKYVAPYVISQQELNELYIGEDFVLSVRLAQTLQLVFYSLMYSSGIPLMYWTALIALLAGYALDKFYFVRLVRTPPQFSQALQMWTIQTMEWALVLHCFFGFWMYSSPSMFPATPADARASALGDLARGLAIPADSVQATEYQSTTYSFVGELPGRFNKVYSIIMILTGVAIIAYKMLRYIYRSLTILRPAFHFISNVFRACLGKERRFRVQTRVANAMHFSYALKQRRVAGVLSYNILANPAYQRLFQLQDDRVEQFDNEMEGDDEEEMAPVPSGSQAPSNAEGDSPLNKAASTVGAKGSAAVSATDDDSKSTADRDNKSVGGGSSARPIAHSMSRSVAANSQSHGAGGHGYQSLAEALNIKKGATVTSIRERAVWKDTASNASTGSKVSTLFPKKEGSNKTPLAAHVEDEIGAGHADDDARSHKSTKSHKSKKNLKAPGGKGGGDDSKSVASTHSAKSKKGLPTESADSGSESGGRTAASHEKKGDE